MTFALPQSVLVIVHTPDLHVLLLQRVARPGWWQSVTGAREEHDATLHDTARRELFEETGIEADTLQAWNWVNRYMIWPAWRHRYAPDVTHNVEHTFSVRIAAPCAVRLSPAEHERYIWMLWRDAIARCLSPTNREALRLLPRMASYLPSLAGEGKKIHGAGRSRRATSMPMAISSTPPTTRPSAM